jgi:Putative beta barrel porin-7 (BBP7)
MRSTIVASIGLALGLSVGSARAQDIQWRPVAPAIAAQPTAPAVGLRAPVANSGPVRQTSFSSTSPSDDGTLVRAKGTDAPAQPLPIGPILSDSEQGPAPTIITPAPTATDKWGQATTKQPATMIQAPTAIQGPMVMDMNGAPPVGMGGNCPTCGPTSCSVCDDCGECGWWTRLWHSCCGCCGFGTTTCTSCTTCCDPCCDTCCDACCAPRPRFWISGEYLGWTVKTMSTPALVTVNPNGSTNLAIGSPGTSIAFGGSGESFDFRSGGRVTLGFALPCTCNQLGFETTYFFLANSTKSASFGPSGGTASIGRPFLNVGPFAPATGEDAEIVAAPLAGVNGTVGIRTTDQFWGIEENARYPIVCGCNWKLDLLAGFRYLNLQESLQIGENLTVTQTTPSGIGTQLATDPTNFAVADSFSTRNNFYGGQLGLDGEWRHGRWFLGATGKVAVGDMQQSVSINGATVITGGPGAGTFPGGLLALKGTNIGTYNRDVFAVVPEVGVKLGFYFTERLRGFVGYDVIYASNVVRPGDQIDRNVNPTYQPNNGPPQGAPLPGFQFRTSDFWAQGLTAGIEWRY